MFAQLDNDSPLLNESALHQGFGMGATAVGITMSVYALARLVMNLPAGLLADRHGRKPLLVWGPAVTAFGEHYADICMHLLGL